MPNRNLIVKELDEEGALVDVLEGAQVKIYSSTNTLLDTLTTNGSGVVTYNFSNGTYFLEITPPTTKFNLMNIRMSFKNEGDYFSPSEFLLPPAFQKKIPITFTLRDSNGDPYLENTIELAVRQKNGPANSEPFPLSGNLTAYQFVANYLNVATDRDEISFTSTLIQNPMPLVKATYKFKKDRVSYSLSMKLLNYTLIVQ